MIMRFFEKFFIIICIMCFSAGSAHAESFRIVVFGDSLTSGYELQPEQAFPARLERKIKEVGFDVRVINMSVAGETTSGGMERVNSVLVQQPDIVILELGANDALRGIGVNIIQRNLEYILDRLKEKNIYVIFVGMKAASNMGAAYGEQLSNMYRNMATLRQLPFYPFALEGIFGHPELNLADSFHPNSKGVDVMINGIYPLVDTGLRYLWDTKMYQSGYQQQNAPTAVTAEPAPAAPAPTAAP